MMVGSKAAGLLALVGLCGWTAQGQETCSLPGELREDCGFLGITQGECEAKQCCWSPISSPSGDFPWCFHPAQVECGEYSASNVRQTSTGLAATLQLVNEGCQYYGEDITTLELRVDYETDERLRVRIYDPNNARWEIPNSLVSRPAPTENHEKSSDLRFGFVSKPFGFYVSRAGTNEVLFNSSASGNNPLFKNLVFEDQYLEISTQMPSNPNVYGLGERVRPMRLEEGLTYTLWTADEPTPINQNLYGSHPFYLEMRNGKAHGVLLMNSNGMDIDMDPGVLTYHVLGGVLDFYFFSGPSPASIVDQYTQLVGRPYMFADWALGFHHCRYGFKNLDEVKGVVQGYAEAKIPLDTIWIDIDHMDEYRVWTFDPVNFPAAEVKKFVEELHAKNMKNVLIVDPGMKNETGYKYYDIGLEQDLFIKSKKTGEPMLGMVWPYYTVFPDFLHPKTQDYWTNSIKDFLGLVPVDGLWIDMNEVASFCTGEELSTCQYPEPFEPKAVETEEVQPAERRPKRSSNAFDPNNPNYRINNNNDRSPLARKTTSMDAYHHGNVLEYDAHNVYGLSEGIATTKALEQLTNKRAFVLSRSTFPGSGKHLGHWTGDNWSKWDHLYYSIPGMLNFQLFGIPYVGADICGFIQDTTEELCARWMQLGAFYPFARNHNTLGASPQEPFLWEVVAESSRRALGIRYSLFPLYYTLMYQAHTAGATIVRPLFFEFPSDPKLLDLDTQFMIGSAILVSPVLQQGAKSVDAYFPKGLWYDFYSFEKVPSQGEVFTLDAPLEVIPLHIRGGSILVQHYSALTVPDTRKNNFFLTAALDENGAAQGTFYNDDGSSLNASNFTLASLKASKSGATGTLSFTGSFGFSTPSKIDAVAILGVSSAPKTVAVDGASVPFNFSNGVVTLSSLSVSMNKAFTITWA